MKRKLSPWCKEVKKTLIDRDMSVTELCGEVSKKFSVNKVTVYEDIKIAKERLSSLFFGIDGLKFF